MARKVCQGIKCVFIVALVLYSLTLVVSLVGVIAGGMGQSISNVASAFIYVAFHGLLIVAFLYLMVRIFAEVGYGSPPFSEKQANRLRLIAILALAFAILELVYTASMSYSIIPEVGYSIGINDAYPADSINLNVGMLAFSAIMYSLSALFRYAALLQQLSDDTV
ncbi:hypothetical protein VIN30_07270 [Adlercreutzia sp. R7]|uniref:DUF2975 domain-containing protein n=1 Tax=Adlercreutzia wanghongyangiae TaxID=3111451 RepID=A0ABU6IIL0_9ACTN|nr:hypothetical protein [Adlercreutzia sp. R7]